MFTVYIAISVKKIITMRFFKKSTIKVQTIKIMQTFDSSLQTLACCVTIQRPDNPAKACYLEYIR
jgi:hypothetical protein